MIGVKAFTNNESFGERCDECGKTAYQGVWVGAVVMHRRCWDAVAKRVKQAIKDGGLL